MVVILYYSFATVQHHKNLPCNHETFIQQNDIYFEKQLPCTEAIFNVVQESVVLHHGDAKITYKLYTKSCSGEGHKHAVTGRTYTIGT